MLFSEIQTAVYARIANATGLVHTIYGREGDGSYERGKTPYMNVSIVPLDNVYRVYCDKVTRAGFILANVFAPNGYGEIEPTMECEKILALFPEGLQFNGIEIPDEGNIRGPLDDDNAGWFYVSTLIYFEA